jgi:hypothetical protein
MRIIELLEDDDGELSCYRFCFILGTIGLLALATAQFVGLGSLPTALYAILGTMASGGYLGGKITDRMYATNDSEVVDESRDETN